MREHLISQLKKRLCAAVFLAVVLILAGMLHPAGVSAEDTGIPDGYEGITFGPPHTRLRNVFGTETIDVSGIRVVVEQTDEAGNITKTDPEEVISFRIFNTTTQEDEFGGLVETVMDEDGRSYLPDLSLKKDHDYIISAEDRNYRNKRDARYPAMSKTYVQIRHGDAVTATEGPGAYNYMIFNSLKYNRLREISVERRDSVCADPYTDNLYDTGSTIRVRYKGSARAGVRFRLVSEDETIETTSGSGGVFSAKLREGVSYMVYVDSDKYSIDPFPIIVKDKSDTGEGLYCFNHSTCVMVDTINLYDKGNTDFDGMSRNTSADSLKKRSTVTGMNFRNLQIVDRILDERVDELAGKDYQVVSFSAVTPTRWEISKLAGMNFGITWRGCGGKLVSHLYVMNDNGTPEEIAFSQTSGDNVSFTMDSLSLHPAVIEYDSSRTYADKVAEEQAAQRKAAEEQAARERMAREAAWRGTIDRKLPAPKIIKPKSAGKSMTVRWKKLSKKQLKKAGGIRIEVQYSLNKRFPMEKTKSKYLSKKKTSVKIRSLKSRKTYYVRVRTYRGTGTAKKVSKWSKVKKIKVK